MAGTVATRATGYYTTEKISANIEKTPEGFVLCRDVPVARIGTQMYAKGEIPVQPDADGLIRIERTPAEVFKQESLDSYIGKPVTIEHPPGNDVSPATYHKFAVGTTLNPRVRGNEEVIVDLLIYEPEAIRVVLEKEKREVSAGYDCEYIQFAPGSGAQKDIIINHVAIVDDGRCGTRCAIGDTGKQLTKGRKHMTLKEWAVKVRAAFTGNKTDELATLMSSVPARVGDDDGGGTGELHLHMAPKDGVTADDFEAFKGDNDKEHKDIKKTCDSLDERVKVLEASAGEGNDKTGDGKRSKDDDNPELTTDKEMEEEKEGASKTGDSATLGEVMQRVMSQSEIIFPGVPVMTLDSKAAPKVTLSGICAHRRKTIGFALSVPKTYEMVTEVRGGRTLDHNTLAKLNCGSVKMLFEGVHALAKTKNTADHAAATVPYDPSKGFVVSGAGKSPAEVNAANRKLWAGK